MFEIGNSLREARLRQQLELTDAELATKIRCKYIKALEDEQFGTLPSPTYVKGFLRTYAEYLGLNGALYVDEYNSRFLVGGGEEEQPLRPRRSQARPRREHRLERNAIVIAIIGIGVVTALVIAAWKFGGGSSSGVSNLKPKTPAPAHARIVSHLSARAHNGSAVLQVRANSASGKTLYEGTLLPGAKHRLGKPVSFSAPRLWLSISSPEHVQLRLNGRLLKVGAVRPCVLLVTRQVLPAGPGSC